MLTECKDRNFNDPNEDPNLRNKIRHYRGANTTEHLTTAKTAVLVPADK